LAKEVVKVGFVKIGNIGMSRIVDLVLDERADREDVDACVVASGAKMTAAHAESAAKALLQLDPDFAVVISPNAALPGPKKARDLVKEGGKPCIVISDAPGKKAVEELKNDGFGYIILTGDPMIGARRQFLDPVEMSLFNADVLKVLSVCGAVRLVQEELDAVIEQIKKGETPTLPQIIANAETVVSRASFANPYAAAKAFAAYSIAEKVADINVQACFVVKEAERYVPMCAAAHEVMRYAALLADEAYEIEKYGDSLLRTPHARSGEILKKRKLLERPA